MTHLALTGPALQALATCVNRIFAAVLIPDGSYVRALVEANLWEVSWLVLRFTDGSELELWPDTRRTPLEN